MFTQIALGSGLMMISIVIGAISALVMELALSRWHNWLISEPHYPKLILVVVIVSVWIPTTLSAGVWLWAATFQVLGAFATFEECLYFSLVTFTTLGYGDVLPPHEWRILGGMTSANGLLNFGLLTALLVEALRHVRVGQVRRKVTRKGG
jgi:voltage-gated potassium channel Kch